jgi:polar amino acid transport system substrate-binding protein
MPSPAGSGNRHNLRERLAEMRWRSVRGALPVLILLMLISASASGAASARQDYVIGVEDLDYAPLWRTGSSGWQGVARDLLDAFSADTGVRLEYRPLPVRRLLREFLNGDVDAKFPDSPDWEPTRKSGFLIHYSGPVISYVDGVNRPPDQVGQPNLRRLSTVLGFTPVGFLDQIRDGRILLEQQQDFPSLLRFTLSGRADGAYGNNDVVTYTLREKLGRPGALVFDPSLPSVRGDYRLSSLKHPELITRLDRWMKQNPARIAEIRQRYNLQTVPPP